MNTIDQRILIPASPGAIWNLVSRMENNPLWQVNSRSVSYLTTHHDGQGMRYRSTNARGKETIVEVKAWYDNVGYAYEIVDGTPYKSNRGTIRLQEIAEGTIVQWMFEYDLTGFLGGMRNALSVRRSIENDIIESLEMLWRVVTERTPSQQYISKSLIREAPDAEARAQYKPRHVSADADPLSLDEPPVEEEDTRPRPAVSASVQTEDKALESTPKADISEQFLVQEPSALPMQEPEFLSRIPAGDLKQEAPPEPAPELAMFKSPETPVTEKSWSQQAAAIRDEPAPIAGEARPDAPTPPRTIPPITNPRDTATVNIFDLFGLPKPSETQQIEAVRLEQGDPTISQSIPRVEIEAEGLAVSQPIGSVQTEMGRLGMRIILRRRLINIRKP